MLQIELKKLVEITGAKVLSQTTENFLGIGTDTRQDLKGFLFIALKGESFDAHQFLLNAEKQGAAGVLVHEENAQTEELKSRITVLKVQDTLKALQEIGTWARLQSKAKIVAITGSNGKTTTKEFTAALIGTVRKVHFNQGSFNNHWGVPFTLMQIPAAAEVAVVEMGMNHAGELTELVQIAQPDVVVCTTVGRAHMEFFGSLEKVAEAKEEIYLHAPKSAKQIFNLDNELTYKMYERALQRLPKEQIQTFSAKDAKADIYLQIESMTMESLTIKGQIQGVSGHVKVEVFGAQNLVNLMAAASLGLSVGMTPTEIWKGLEKCKTNWGRNQLVHLKSGARMIFDAYNANPDSMRALIDNMELVKTQGRKVGVFGQMRELGSTSADLHQELGQWVGSAGFDRVYFIGDDHSAFAEGLKKSGFKADSSIAKDFSESAGNDLAAFLKPDDVVVVKASRGTKLERFVFPCEPLDFAPKQ